MPLFKPAPPSVDEPEGLTVPDHLVPYFEDAPGPTEIETRNYFLSPPKTISIRQDGAYRRPDEELEVPVVVPHDEWAHQIKLRNAEMLRAKTTMAQAVEDSLFDCPVCHEETWAGDSARLDLDNGHAVRLCQGCYPLVRDEQIRRRHAPAIDEILTGGSPTPAVAPNVGWSLT